MRSYEASAISAAGPEDVWARWIDVPRWSDVDGMESARLIGPFDVGSVLKTKARGFPESTLTITVVERPRLWTDESRTPGLRMTFEHLIEPMASGTKVTERVLLSGPLAWIAGPLLRRKMQRLIVAATASIAQTAGESAVQRPAADS